MTELEESVVELLVKKLGVEKEEVEKAHTSFLDKHPEGHMTRLVLLQKTENQGLNWMVGHFFATLLCRFTH